MSDSGWSNQAVLAFLVEVITGVPGSGLFVYNGTPALGNPPITSITAGTTDPSGNVVKPTIEVQGTGSIWIVGSAGQAVRLTATGYGTAPAIAFITGRSEELLPANVQAGVGNTGLVNEFLDLIVQGPQITGTTDTVDIALTSAAKDGSFNSLGSLSWVSSSSVTFSLLNWGASGVTVRNTFPGDSTQYRTSRFTTVLASDLVINTVGFSQQVFSTIGLGVGTYMVEGFMHLGLSAAGVPSFEFGTSGGLTATMLFDFMEINDAAPATFGNSGTVNGFAVPFGGAVMGAGTRNVRFTGNIVVSASGNFGLFAQTSNVADPFTITHLCSYMNVYPVGG